MTGTERFGAQRRSESFDALLGQQRIVEHARQMRYAGKRRQLRANPRQQFGNLSFVADVCGEGVDPAAVALGDFGDHPFRICIGRAPAGQHDVTGSELSEV